jgi:hypothetical protein
VAVARGSLCQKMDDDDWYAPSFLHTMVSFVQASRTTICRPSVAFVMPFLLFDVARWEVRQSLPNNAPGATLLFVREDREQHPFHGLFQDEDVWFYHDQLRAGARPLPVGASEIFLAVRHRGSVSDRDHTWTRQGNGQVLEDYFQTRPLHAGGPESLLPRWAVAAYRDLQRELLPSSA